jgi:hypothetical protein
VRAARLAASAQRRGYGPEDQLSRGALLAITTLADALDDLLIPLPVVVDFVPAEMATS